MALTVALGDSCRAVRMVVSLELARQQIMLVSAAGAVSAALMLLFRQDCLDLLHMLRKK